MTELVPAEDFLREREGGAQRRQGGISLWEWGNEPVGAQQGLMGNVAAGRLQRILFDPWRKLFDEKGCGEF